MKRALRPGTIKLEVPYALSDAVGLATKIAEARKAGKLAAALGAQPIDDRVLVVYGEDSAEVWFREAAVVPPVV